MLIDMHAHTSGISRCCRTDAHGALMAAREVGIDGLVLCNHYDANYVGDGTPEEFAEKYIAEYYRTAMVAAEMGMRLYFGVEVTARKHGGAHILLYGMEPAFVLEHADIYDYTLEQMHAAVHEKGGLVVQAHPFRSNGHVLDTAYLDGVEINCHPLYDATHCERMQEIAHEANIIVTCGGDYHADTYRAVCGTHFPDSALRYCDIIDHLKNSPEIKMHVHELRTEFHRDVTFIKG
ncbi:MAG: hypothetical protein IJC54_05590 [Clostridia bacterium]|nr:hypothetical protein [Clostridia bacterium]MBQ4086025.1 hypothetical protein [Clostridia bacterium]